MLQCETGANYTRNLEVAAGRHELADQQLHLDCISSSSVTEHGRSHSQRRYKATGPLVMAHPAMLMMHGQ